MSNYRAGDIIRMTREFVGMSREELSDEICSVQTLYRIESGKTRVKRELYARLMAKMERVPEKSYAICVGKNLELLEERKLFEQAMQNYDYEKADLYLGRMKEKADDNVITRQYLLKSEALMDYYCKRSDNQTTIEKLQEAVRLTLPDYEECLKKDFPFTEQEIMNLMSLANAYAHAGDVDEAVYIFERLLQCLQKDYIFGAYADYMKVLILRNLTVTYNKQKRYNILDRFSCIGYGFNLPCPFPKLSRNLYRTAVYMVFARIRYNCCFTVIRLYDKKQQKCFL